MNYIYIASAVVMGVLGLFVGHKTKKPEKKPDDTGITKAKAVLDEQAKETKKAGDKLANSLAADADARTKSVLDWLRKRTGNNAD